MAAKEGQSEVSSLLNYTSLFSLRDSYTYFVEPRCHGHGHLVLSRRWPSATVINSYLQDGSVGHPCKILKEALWMQVINSYHRSFSLPSTMFYDLIVRKFQVDVPLRCYVHYFEVLLLLLSCLLFRKPAARLLLDVYGRTMYLRRLSGMACTNPLLSNHLWLNNLVWYLYCSMPCQCSSRNHLDRHVKRRTCMQHHTGW